MHPIRRIATLDEVSAMVCYLTEPNGGYMTGGVIDIAGVLSTSGALRQAASRAFAYLFGRALTRGRNRRLGTN